MGSCTGLFAHGACRVACSAWNSPLGHSCGVGIGPRRATTCLQEQNPWDKGPRRMWNQIVKKLVGTKHEREMKRLQPLLGAINGFEPKVKALGEAELRVKTAEFRQRLDQGASLDDILPEAFAVCREAGRRVLGMRHYDVQLIGGITLHRGRIAEMKTGEGKTLVATLAAYLNALPGKGVHVVTVNGYLARRDAEWMSKLYGYLGLTTG